MYKTYSKEEALARQVILEGGELVQKRLEESQTYQKKKNGSDLVTAVDREVEQFLIRELKREFPNHYFLTEETNPEQKLAVGQDQYTWVIDPIDGTMNFVHGFERCSISVALYENGEALIGLILDIHSQQLYSATKGEGAFCNGEPIRVSSTKKLEESLVGFGFSAEQWMNRDVVTSLMGSIASKSRGIRLTGSSCLDLIDVAAGRLDGFWHYDLAPWDIAAGMLIVSEAGGSCVGINGEADVFRSNGIVAANGLLHQDIVRILSAQ